MEEWTPKPQESGSLDPPRRRPPTAVGITTPPPPRPRGSEHYSRRSRLQRRARALIGFLTTFGGGVAIGSLFPPAASITVATVLSTLLLALHIRRRRWRRLRSRHQPSASRAA
jgi:hypothetical protein